MLASRSHEILFLAVPEGRCRSLRLPNTEVNDVRPIWRQNTIGLLSGEQERETCGMEKFSLEAIAREQVSRAAASSNGRSSHTVYGGHEHALRQTVIALKAGVCLDEHESPGEATVQVLRGRVRLTAGETVWEGRSGDLLVVPDARHGLEAIEDAAVLLTVSKAVRPGRR